MKAFERLSRLFSKIRRVRYRGLVTATVMQWIGRAGVKLVRYNLYLEDVHHLQQMELNPRLQRIATARIIKPADLTENPLAEDLQDLKFDAGDLCNHGAVCVGVFHYDTIVGCVWYSLDRCRYKHLSFDLGPREAYVFGLKAARNFRWAALVAMDFVFKHLSALKKDRLYSVTECSNTPVMNMRRKLRSRCCSCYLYVGIGRFGRNIAVC